MRGYNPYLLNREYSNQASADVGVEVPALYNPAFGDKITEAIAYNQERADRINQAIAEMKAKQAQEVAVSQLDEAVRQKAIDDINQQYNTIMEKHANDPSAAYTDLVKLVGNAWNSPFWMANRYKAKQLETEQSLAQQGYLVFKSIKDIPIADPTTGRIKSFEELTPHIEKANDWAARQTQIVDDVLKTESFDGPLPTPQEVQKQIKAGVPWVSMLKTSGIFTSQVAKKLEGMIKEYKATAPEHYDQQKRWYIKEYKELHPDASDDEAADAADDRISKEVAVKAMNRVWTATDRQVLTIPSGFGTSNEPNSPPLVPGPTVVLNYPLSSLSKATSLKDMIKVMEGNDVETKEAARHVINLTLADLKDDADVKPFIAYDDKGNIDIDKTLRNLHYSAVPQVGHYNEGQQSMIDVTDMPTTEVDKKNLTVRSLDNAVKKVRDAFTQKAQFFKRPMNFQVYMLHPTISDNANNIINTYVRNSIDTHKVEIVGTADKYSEKLMNPKNRENLLVLGTKYKPAAEDLGNARIVGFTGDYSTGIIYYAKTDNNTYLLRTPDAAVNGIAAKMLGDEAGTIYLANRAYEQLKTNAKDPQAKYLSVNALFGDEHSKNALNILLAQTGVQLDADDNAETLFRKIKGAEVANAFNTK